MWHIREEFWFTGIKNLIRKKMKCELLLLGQACSFRRVCCTCIEKVFFWSSVSLTTLSSCMFKTMHGVCFVITSNPALVSLNCWQHAIQLKSFLVIFFLLLADEISLVLTPEDTVFFPFHDAIIRSIAKLNPGSQLNILIQVEHTNLS